MNDGRRPRLQQALGRRLSQAGGPPHLCSCAVVFLKMSAEADKTVKRLENLCLVEDEKKSVEGVL